MRAVRRRRVGVAMAAVAAVVAGCGNGRSILEIGGATVPTVAPPDSGGQPVTIPSTTAVPADLLAPCRVEALGQGAPVAITFWHAMTAANEDALVALTDAYNA